MQHRMSPAVLAAVGVVVFFTAPPVWGQIPTFEGEEVVVSGRRPQQVATTPAYVSVILGEELRRMGFLTLGDALAFIAEGTVRTAGTGIGGLQQASIRGSTPQQVLVLIDGVPLNATAQFGVNLATITLAEVERVEVLRGPYSALLGSFGVIQVVTRRDAGRRLAAAAGGYGTRQGVLRLAGGSGILRYAVAAEALATSGYRPNGDAGRWTASGRLTLTPPNAPSLSLWVHHATGEGGVPGSTDSPSLTDRLADRRTALALEWTRGAADGPRTQARLWWLGDGLQFTSVGFASRSWGAAVGAEVQHVARLSAGGVLTTGLEWQRSSFDYADTFSAFQAGATTAAGYMQYDTLIGSRTLVGAGLRYETHSVYGTRLNPRLGFVHFLSPTVRLRGGTGLVSRAPTLGELFFPLCSNPALQPELAWASDLGIEVTVREALRLRVNGFYTDAQNLIVGGCNPQNVGSARVAGLSAEAVGLLSDRWAISANVTWSDGVDRTTGERLLRLPPWQANLIVRYALAPGANLSLVANHVSDRDDVTFPPPTFSPTRVTLPPHVVLGVRMEQAVGSLVLRAGVDNLLNTAYETLKGFPGPGSTVWLQVTGGF